MLVQLAIILSATSLTVINLTNDQFGQKPSGCKMTSHVLRRGQFQFEDTTTNN